ncbi:arabinan endo-1,5-alpha-L-arabinosidase [Asticcacaulis solisilvae]|uniref:arabinan endo-1,5-alpha-L-arabinosidase n=1 Tax=Asticcacaulis solisilvae TaxID=1217274 RepID=UPI003FD6D8B5
MLTRRQFSLMTVAGLAAGPGLASAQTLNDRMTGDVSPVHDPCIIKANGLYHVFCTSQMRAGKGLIHWRTSPDLVTWTFRGAVMPAFPGWVMAAVPETKGAWAPDISFSHGRYRLYYAASTFGKNQSVIGLVTTPTLDPADPAFGWKDEGLVVASMQSDDFNAIDPNAFVDADGRHWLSFGSFWSGIKLIELDPATGKPKPDAKRLAVAGRSRPSAIEAPFIIRRGDDYYLFVSFDFCCRGADSSYYTVVGRSKSVSGPYFDRDGTDMLRGGGTTVLRAEAGDRWKGPGHCAVLEDAGRHLIVYHAYDADNGGKPVLRIRPLDWTADGWPAAV